MIRKSSAVLLLLLLAVLVFRRVDRGTAKAQPGTSVWVRAGAPFATQIISPGCTNATPMVCTVTSVVGLVAGDIISVWGVCAAIPSDHNVSAANGIRKIGAIAGSTISLQDQSGVDIAGNGSWCPGTANGWASGIQSVGKLTQMFLIDPPRGMFDGLTGVVTRRWATSTNNGLISLIVTSNMATVTYGYDHGLNSGDKVKIWNTTSSTISASGGSEYSVTVTGARTYTFPVTVANGDYTHNDTCGTTAPPAINGTDNCVVMSAGATSTNRWWATAISRTPTPASGNYQWAYANPSGPRTDVQYGIGPILSGEVYAEAFYLDRKNTGYLNAALDILRTLKYSGGNNAIGTLEANDFGNYEWSEQVSNQFALLGTMYDLVGQFLTSGETTALIDLINKDVTDPGGCTPAVPVRVSVNSGTARAGSATTIQLAVAASAVDDAYKDYVIDVTLLASGDRVAGRVTGYVGATRTATVTDWHTLSGSTGAPPSNGDTYNVWESSSVSGTTVTGYNTHWNTAGADQVHVGDYVISLDLWLQTLNAGRIGYYVTAVNSDTSLTVTTGQNGYVTGTTTPQVTWISPARQSTDCGFMYVQNAFPGAFGSQPTDHPVRGGYDTHNYGSNIASGLAAFQTHAALAFADVDPTRSARNLSRWTQAALDYSLDLAMSYDAGILYSGESYNTTRAQQAFYNIAQLLHDNIVGYPSVDITGNWVAGFQFWKLFGLHPDAYQWPLSGNAFGNFPAEAAMALDYGIVFDRTATPSKYAQYFLDNTLALTSGITSQLTELAIRMDPRTLTSDYRGLPLQYLFTATSRATAVHNFDWPFPANWRGGGFISRSSWTDPAACHIWYGARAFVGDHDQQVQPGDLQLYCGGAMFLSNDNIPPGDMNSTLTGPYIQFGPTTSYRGSYDTDGPATPEITKWAGSVPFGDPNSVYTCAKSTLDGAYAVSITRATRNVCHIHNGSDPEILITWTDVLTPGSAAPIRDTLYYTQNAQGAQSINGVIVTAPEGDSTCPGAGGCASINTNGRQIESHGDGLSTGGPLPLPGSNRPTRNKHVTSTFLSPGSVCVSWDGTSYPAANGNAYRATIYGGTTCGGNAGSLESVVVHEINTIGTTPGVPILLTADSTWAVAQTDKTVTMFARGGSTNTSASFTSTHTGTAVYVAANSLAPGTYTATLNGSPVSGSPFSVAVGSDSLKFTSAAGAIVITQTSSSVSGSTVGGKARAGGSAQGHL